MYDEAADVWLLKGHLSEGTHSHGMCSDGSNTMYVAGGAVLDEEGRGIAFSSNLYMVDMDLFQVKELEYMPYYLRETCLVFNDGYLYVVGGVGMHKDSEVSTIHDMILKYDINEDEWTECTQKLPEPVAHGCAAILVMPHDKD